MTTHQSAPRATTPRAPDPTPIRLPLYRNPLRLLLSASLWRSAWFLICYLVLGWLFFSAVFTAVTVTAVLAITLAGVPLLIATAAIRFDISRSTFRAASSFEVQLAAMAANSSSEYGAGCFASTALISL